MRTSIRFKISGLLVIVVCLLMGGTGFAIIRLVRNSFLEEIKLRGIILARNVAFSAEDPLMDEDDLTLTLLSRDALRHTGSIYAYILDQQGLTAASPARLIRKGDSTEIVLEDNLWRKQISQAIPVPEEADYAAETITDPQWGAIYEVAVPVMLGGQKKIGEVHVGIDLTSLQIASRRIQMVVGGITVIGIIVGILSAFGLGTLLIRPLKALVGGVAEIARGNFEYRIRKTTNDEIGDLTSAFNIMAKDLKDKVLIEDAFKRYVSHQVADEILKDPDVFAKSLKGTKKRITAFFGDIRGFTPISEQLPPEEVVAFLNFYLTEMTTIIFANEGTIDKFMGDCIMAVFGAPVEHSDDVYRAVKSGVEIQKRIEEMNKQRITEGKQDIHVGIGINYGEAVVGNIGSTQRLEYTVIGDSVNTAARLQTVAKGGEIVVSDSVYREVKDHFDFIHMEPVKVKGKARSLKVWKIALPICTAESLSSSERGPQNLDPEVFKIPPSQPS
ncbi:HAMP domain-containing protein [candidate division WOR-3 bacterium]|nr:HAMP domain-containing protein [candidate division WOR-3 bacterium]